MSYRRRSWPPDARADWPVVEGRAVTRDELLSWLLLPWNIVKAIALTVWWIVAAIVRGGRDEDDVTPTAAPTLQSAPTASPRWASRIPRLRRASRESSSVASVEPPRP